MGAAPERLAIPVVLLSLALSAGIILTHSVNAEEPQAAPQTPPQTEVEVAEVVSRQVVDWQSYSGRLEAVDQVEVRALVPGTLTKVHFKDGSLVKQGDVLFSIDPRPYQAEVERAQAQVAAAEARAAYTAADLNRVERLVKENAVSRRDFEERQHAAREATANLQAAQASLTAAKLNLGYTQITAPVSGRVSHAEITSGNVISAGAGSKVLTTLVAQSYLYATFDVDEQSFLKYVNPARVAQTPLPVYLGLANEAGFSREGRVNSVDNQLDTSSGTIRVRAIFDNSDGTLLPGLFARIRLGGGASRPAVLIDEKAVGTDQDKRFVLILDETNRAMYREIKLGASQQGLRIVETGLAAGDRIVVNGLQRARPGDRVAPRMVPMPGAQTSTAHIIGPSAAGAAISTL